MKIRIFHVLQFFLVIQPFVAETGQLSLADLPTDVFTTEIIKNIDYIDLCNVSITNKNLYQIITKIPKSKKIQKLFDWFNQQEVDSSYTITPNSCWQSDVYNLWKIGQFFSPLNIIKTQGNENEYLLQEFDSNLRITIKYLNEEKLKENFDEDYYNVINQIAKNRLAIYSMNPSEYLQNPFYKQNHGTIKYYHYFFNFNSYNTSNNTSNNTSKNIIDTLPLDSFGYTGKFFKVKKNKPVFLSQNIILEWIKNKSIVKLNFCINNQDQNGNTPLLLAIKKDCFTIAFTLLLNNQIDINHRNEDGESALIIAAKKTNLILLKKILQYDPNHDFKDKNNKTAMFYAIQQKNLKFIDVLTALQQSKKRGRF